MTLSAAFAALPASGEEWDGHHRLGPLPEGVPTLAALGGGGASLERLVARKQEQARGGDRRLGCAYLAGDLGWELGRVFGGLWLAGWRVSAADPAAITLAPRAVDWEEEGLSGTFHALDLVLDPAGLAGAGTTHRDLGRTVEGLVAAIVATLARETRLGQAAQWRLVGDGLAAALLDRGRALGRMEEAIALGRAVLADRTLRLRSAQTEFVEIALSHRPGVRDWFRLRGGCCRFYTATGESGEYCTTCVLRDREDQIARLTDWLDRSTAPGTAE